MNTALETFLKVCEKHNPKQMCITYMIYSKEINGVFQTIELTKSKGFVEPTVVWNQIVAIL